MITKMNKPDFYISSQSQLDDAVTLIRQANRIAIDTEFTRRVTYYPVLSLVQIALQDDAKKQKSFIVDCVCDLDLTELFAIISNSRIEKIFHSSRQDLQIFHYNSNAMPGAIIDTQIMANFCGFGFNAGYSSLVKKIFGRDISKKQQNSDWQRRPLSKKQIEYAIVDVVFLEEIYERFLALMEKNGRHQWYCEEVKIFMEKALLPQQENLLKNFAFKGLNSRQIAQIRNLVFWRENQAKKTNVPRKHFLSDEAIGQIVRFAFVGKNLVSKLSQEALFEIEKILASEEKFSGETGRFFMNEMQRKYFQEAKKLIADVAAKENFSAQFLLTSSDVTKMIWEKSFFDETITGWRKEVFGKELKEIIFN